MIDHRRQVDTRVARADAELACAATAEDIAQADRLALRARAWRTSSVLVGALAGTGDLRAEIRLQIRVRRWFEEHGPRLGGPALDSLADVLESEELYRARYR